MRVTIIFHALFNFLNQSRALLPWLFAILNFPHAGASLDDIAEFHQASKPLREALIDLGKSTDISIIFPTYLLRGYKAPNLEGKCSTRDALKHLLEDTDLSFKEINTRVVAITLKKIEVAPHKSLPIIEEVSVLGRSVTGSRIPRTDLLGSSPVDVISAPELRLAGSQTLGEFLKFIPAVSGNSTSTAVSNSGDGTATVTLRGLPANNTLVLLNGKRIAHNGLAGDSVDLNSISPAAVERIEIVKDGASAIYGSDAIAGVVNIILKNKFQGLQLEQYYGETSHNDLETTTTSLLWGKTFENASLFLSATHFEQNGLFSRDRELSASADTRFLGGADLRSSATPASRIVIPKESILILNKDAGGNYLPGTSRDHYRLATKEDLYNYLSETSSVSPSKRQSLYAKGTYQWSEDTKVTTELGYASTSAEITLAPTPLFTAFEDIPLSVAADNIYNPFDVEITDIRRRVLELGPRQQKNDADAFRFSFTLDGYTKGFHWDITGHWSKTKATEDFINVLNATRTRRALGPNADCQGIDIDGCEPLNLFGPPGSITSTQLDYVRESSHSYGFSQTYGYSFNLNAELAELKNGPLLFAAGVDIRRDAVKVLLEGYNADNTFIGGGVFDPTFGSRHIYEAYSELQIPLIEQISGIYSLYLDLAARHSIYSDFGKSTTPKIGLRYRPIADILIRATYSEGFRAPSLAELHKGGSQTQAVLNDPCTIGENVGALPGCQQQSDTTRTQYLTIFGGDVNLEPEESSNSTFGLVWSPSFDPGLLFSIDYFKIIQTNVVDASAQFIVNQNAYHGLYGDRVERDKNGNIAKVLATFINIGEREVSGLDMTLKYQWQQLNSNFIATLNASHLRTFYDQIDPSTASSDLAGTFIDSASEGNGALPAWKLNSGIHWSQGNIEASYTINYISSLKEVIPLTNNAMRRIHSWITHDIQISYITQYLNGFRFTLGADNLWDQAPPYAASSLNDNFDARTYDLKGRFWYARVSQTF